MKGKASYFFKMVKSEFGKGLSYCLGLFLCHSEREYIARDFIKTKEDKECFGIINRPSMWFYSAADHLYDLEIPEDLPTRLKNRLKKFRSKVLGWRMTMRDEDAATEEDRIWAIQEAKELLRLIDKNWGVKTSQGGYE